MAFIPFMAGMTDLFGVQTMLPLGMKTAFTRILMSSGILNIVLLPVSRSTLRNWVPRPPFCSRRPQSPPRSRPSSIAPAFRCPAVPLRAASTRPHDGVAPVPRAEMPEPNSRGSRSWQT